MTNSLTEECGCGHLLDNHVYYCPGTASNPQCDCEITQYSALLSIHEPRATLDGPAHSGGDPIIVCTCGWEQDWKHTESWLKHLEKSLE